MLHSQPRACVFDMIFSSNPANSQSPVNGLSRVSLVTIMHRVTCTPTVPNLPSASMMLQREHVTRVLHCSAGNCIGRGKCYCIVSAGAADFSQGQPG